MKKIWMVLILVVLLVPSVGWGEIEPLSIEGKPFATAGEEYKAYARSVNLYIDKCYFDWGDGTNSGWVSASRCRGVVSGAGVCCSATHIWSTLDVYSVRVKGMDTLKEESDWSEPLIVTVQPSSGIIGALENPVPLTGVNPIYGWATHPQGIAKIELYIDDHLIGDIAYGGYRPDVGTLYPDYLNSEFSEFATVYDFSSLSAGGHNIKVRAYNQEGLFKDFTMSVYVKKFHGDFVEVMEPAQRWIRFNRVTSEGITKTYNILIVWDDELQGFKIQDIVGWPK